MSDLNDRFDAWVTEATGGLGLTTAIRTALLDGHREGYETGHGDGYHAGWEDGRADAVLWVDELAGDKPWAAGDAAAAFYIAGYWQAHGDAWGQINNWLGVARSALDLPTQAKLATARRHTNEPCSRGKKNHAANGKVGCDCSRCTRFIAAWLNRAAYGQPDYPGVTRAAEMRKAS